MVPSGVSRTVSSGAACIAETAETAALKKQASDNIVIFMLANWRMLWGIEGLQSRKSSLDWWLELGASVDVD